MGSKGQGFLQALRVKSVSAAQRQMDWKVLILL